MKVQFHDERGSAVLLTLMFTVLLAAIGTGLITTTNTERAAADNFRSGMTTLYAAEALARHTVNQLSARPQWTSALCCDDHSTFTDTSTTHETTWGQDVDVGAATRDLQRQSDALFGASPNRPVWRVYAWGSIETLIGDSPPAFLIAWVADDRSEVDGNPLSDGNGVLLVRAQATGFRGLRRTLELVLKRVANDSSASSESTSAARQDDGGSPGEVARNLPDPSHSSGGESSSGSRIQILSWREVQ